MVGKIVAGADEAARGLVIGPMIIGVCALDEQGRRYLAKLGIKDSKRYSSRKKLAQHAAIIKEKALAWSIQTLSAKVLTNFNKDGLTMDEAEAYGFFRALEEIVAKVNGIKEYQVDNFQAPKKLASLLKQNKKTKDIKLVVIPQAETKYIAVSAGSVLARSQAVHELGKIKAKYGDFGSGSTSDKRTIAWLRNYYKEHHSWPEEIVRTYWKTITNIEQELK